MRMIEVSKIVQHFSDKYCTKCKEEGFDDAGNECARCWVNTAIKEVKGIDWTDAEELTRCKDCANARWHNGEIVGCNVLEIPWNYDGWYCADGERRLNGSTDNV